MCGPTLRTCGRVAILALVVCQVVVLGQSNLVSREATSDIDLYRAMCDLTVDEVVVSKDVTIYETTWPADLPSPPCLRNRNLTIRGVTGPKLITLNMNFVANRLQTGALVHTHFVNMLVENFRNGAGGQFDFVAYSKDAVVWTEFLIKSAPSCADVTNATVTTIATYPLPAGHPEFQDWPYPHNVSLLDTYCRDTYKYGNKCWQKVLWYEEYCTFAVQSTNDPAGYVMAKQEAAKVCESFITKACLNATGGAEPCMLLTINAYRNAILEVNTPALFVAGLCNATVTQLVITRNITLDASSWPANGNYPCSRSNDLLVFGAPGGSYTINFGFAANKLDLSTNTTLKFRDLDLTNVRYGAGEQFDFLTMSSGAVVWLDNVNRNSIICPPQTNTTAQQAKGNPLPVGHPQFANFTQDVELLPSYCEGDNLCWTNVLRYNQHAAESLLLDYGGSYVIVQTNSVKTCNSEVSTECATKSGIDQCLKQGMQDAMLASQQGGQGTKDTPSTSTSSSDNLALKIALPVCLCSAALVGVICLIVVWRKRKAAAARAASSDLKGGKDIEQGNVNTSNGFEYGSKGMLIGSSLLASGYGPSSVHSGALTEPRLVFTGQASSGEQISVTLGALVGGGSFGAVFKATCNDDVVAVKIIRHEASQMASVQHEVNIMTSMTHPNVVRALYHLHHAAGINGGKAGSATNSSELASLERVLQSLGTASSKASKTPSRTPDGHSSSKVSLEGNLVESWIVQEFCDEGSLLQANLDRRFFQAGRLQMAQVLRRLADLAAGMAYLHQLKIIHGDLKSGNVLLATARGSAEASGGSGGAASSTLEAPASSTPEAPVAGGDNLVAKVADFGLSRALQGEQTHQTTRTLGTLTHMPPELLKAGKLAPAGDVYAFGMIMWEVATGRTPYKGMMYGQVVEAVVVSNKRPAFPAYAPARYIELANRCWAADPQQRLTFEQVQAAVAELMAHVAELQAEVDGCPEELLLQPPEEEVVDI